MNSSCNNYFCNKQLNGFEGNSLARKATMNGEEIVNPYRRQESEHFEYEMSTGGRAEGTEH